jgi:tight adherence protein B
VKENFNRWLISNLEGAGLAKWKPKGFFFRLLALTAFVATWSYLMTRVATFSACIALLSGALGFELLNGRAKARRRELTSRWPEVLDSLASAETAGISLAEAFAQLADHAPKVLRPQFIKATAKLDRGFGFDEVMVSVKTDFGSSHADRLSELLRVVYETGGANYHLLLRAQAQALRREIAVMAEIETKQSWVVGTAKLAIAAPWLIVALLSSRPENAAVYNSSAGAAVLLGGLLVSAFAYRAVQLLGALPATKRVLQ